ncbi:MAG: hypothetical protein AAB521_04140 [Patescibacteria group bacterium]
MTTNQETGKYAEVKERLGQPDFTAIESENFEMYILSKTPTVGKDIIACELIEGIIMGANGLLVFNGFMGYSNKLKENIIKFNTKAFGKDQWTYELARKGGLPIYVGRGYETFAIGDSPRRYCDIQLLPKS